MTMAATDAHSTQQPPARSPVNHPSLHALTTPALLDTPPIVSTAARTYFTHRFFPSHGTAVLNLSYTHRVCENV